MIPRSHEVTIWRQSGVSAGRGGARTRGYAAIATKVECNLQPKSGGLRQMAYGREPESMHNGYFAPEVDIRQNDEITVTGGDYLTSQMRVGFAGHHGAKWDVVCDLAESATKLS